MNFLDKFYSENNKKKEISINFHVFLWFGITFKDKNN